MAGTEGTEDMVDELATGRTGWIAALRQSRLRPLQMHHLSIRRATSLFVVGLSKQSGETHTSSTEPVLHGR